MRFCHFITFERAGAAPPAAELAGLSAVLAATPGLDHALLHLPASAHDPYLHDGASPALALQLYFAEIAALEAALAPDGRLQALADPALLPSLRGATVTQQAMLVRRFPVPEPDSGVAEEAAQCTYLVSYQGAAEDLDAWLAHYIAEHPPIMARFPGIRQIEITTRLDWLGSLPFARVAYMQRNKVVFDSPAALTAALASPVRDEMRADFHRFPPFTGPTTHFPMLTRPMLRRGVGLPGGGR
ncbi:MAG: hypothetical protein ABS99_06685 [Acetobacteraceae bacterium SCN 69-10]|nr:MAG: hypothetical protein ABS99_06685 [Acetobacteraceae bacterium SCN 69-10]OJY64992.1 MAG: hypothetical protein BGP12_04510 [Rhodospirillales bacterium 70-18]